MHGGDIRECTVELNGDKLIGKLLNPEHDDELKTYMFRFVTEDNRNIDVSVPDHKPSQRQEADSYARYADKSANNLHDTYAMHP